MAGKTCTVIGMFILIFCISILMWKFERWINWKLSYGPQVEQRLIDVEARLSKLEAKYE